jgi:uncharacterized membrane protein YccC
VAGERRGRPIASARTRLRAKLRDLSPQLRLGLRVTVAAVAAFMLAQILTAPLAGLWTVLTAILVTQTSVGASVRATIEYVMGTLGGAVYAVAIAVLIPHEGEISLLVVLALAIAPLAVLGAVNSHFRVGPFTAVLVILGATATHLAPIDSAFYRVMEVALGGITGLVVSLLVFPARADALVIAAAAEMLELLARALAELAAGSSRDLDAPQIRTLQDSIGAAFTRVELVTIDANGERYLARNLDPSPLLRTLLRLRHDFVMFGRAVAPLPPALQGRLGPPLARVADASAKYLSACSAALVTHRYSPSLVDVDAALEVFAIAMGTIRLERLTQDLPGGEVERIFALGFTLDQLRGDLTDLAHCTNGLAQPNGGTTARAARER